MTTKLYQVPVAGETLTGLFAHSDDQSPLSPAENDQLASQINSAAERDHNGVWINTEIDSNVFHIHQLEVRLADRAICATTRDEVGFLLVGKAS